MYKFHFGRSHFKPDNTGRSHNERMPYFLLMCSFFIVNYS